MLFKKIVLFFQTLLLQLKENYGIVQSGSNSNERAVVQMLIYLSLYTMADTI